MPMKPSAVDAARARLDPGGPALPSGLLPSAPNGKGSRREVRKGEWIDDRVIEIGGPSSPSKEFAAGDRRRMNGRSRTFTAGMVYQVVLGKSCVSAGRALRPGKDLPDGGASLLRDPEVQPCIIDAVELGERRRTTRHRTECSKEGVDHGAETA